MKWIRIIFLILVFFPKVSFSKEIPYKKILKNWTRSDSVYVSENFHASLIWSATLLNDPILKAQARKFADIYKLSEGAELKKLNELKEKNNDKLVFFVSFYTGSQNRIDLADKKNQWDLRLKSGNQTFHPVRIEKITKPAPLDWVYYPYLTRWSYGYYVWFSPDAKNGGPLELSVYHPDAASHLLWK